MTKYEIVKRRQWYYIAKIKEDHRKTTIKYYRKGKWVNNIIKGDSYEKPALAQAVLSEIQKR